MSNDEILKLKFYSKDLDRKITIKKFFQELLLTLFKEKEMFNSKRPFGNSDWDCDLIICLIKNNVIYGKLDEDDYIEDYDWEHYDSVLEKLIKSL